MIQQTFKDIATDYLVKGAIINNEFPGFMHDYLVLHCLLKIYKPNSVFEIGTNYGSGTQIIKNAVPNANVYSLDLPFEDMHESLKPAGKDMVGSNCKLSFTQLRGDSLTFNFEKYPCEAYFIDGEHDSLHVSHETKQAIDNWAKIIIYHDANIPEVLEAILLSMTDDYELYKVEDTRIAYLLEK